MDEEFMNNDMENFNNEAVGYDSTRRKERAKIIADEKRRED